MYVMQTFISLYSKNSCCIQLAYLQYTHTDLYSSRGYFHQNPNFTIIIADNVS